MQNFDPNIKFQSDTFDFSQINLETMPLVTESPECAAKHTRDTVKECKRKLHSRTNNKMQYQLPIAY